MLALKLLALRALAAAADTGASSSDPCFADATNTFHAWIDPYASELGSWKFLECGDTPMPVLAVEKGVTYTFEQFDASVPARKTSVWARRESRTPSPRPRSVDNAGRTGTTPWRSVPSCVEINQCVGRVEP